MPSVLSTFTLKSKGTQKSFRHDGFITLYVVMISQVYACVQTHQNEHIKYVQLLYIKYTSIKLTNIHLTLHQL